MPFPNWIATTPQLGEVNLTDVDPAGPGPSALVGPNAGHAGRNSFYNEILGGYDATMGAGEFTYAQAAISMVPGQVGQMSCSQDANGNMVSQVTPWTGTAYAGQELCVAVSPVGTNQWGWFQVGGYAVTNFGGTTAGATISSITISGATATVTTSTAHGRSVGDMVTHTGATPAAYNGTYLVQSVPSTTTYTLALPSTNLPAGAASVVGTYTYYNGFVAGQTISSATTTTASVAHITTATSHGLQIGSLVSITGATPAAYNVTGAAVSAVGSNTTFDVPLGSAPGGTASTVGAYTQVGANANLQAYYSSTGAISSALVAGKHVVGAQFGASTGAVLGSGGSAKTLPATQCVLDLGRPNSQGSNT